MRLVRRRRSAATAGTDSETPASGARGRWPSRWFRGRGRLVRRLPIVLLAAAVAAVPGGGAVAVSRISERPVPGDQPVAASWSDRTSSTDLDADEFGAGRSGSDWAGSGTTRGRTSSTATARLVSTLGSNGIPSVAMQAYVRAARTMAEVDPSCGLRWSLLAAIGRVESNHGQFGGSGLRSDGTTTEPIRGVALDGAGPVARILDTDGGRLDGDETYDRAVGPMQFIPSSWRRVASDGNDDGESDPNNIYDAALAAGVYLCAGDADLRTVEGRERAVLRYNHSREYVATVLALASSYERGQRGPLPSVGPARTPPAVVRTPTLPPANPGPTPSLDGRGRNGDSGGSGRRPSSTAATTTTRPRSTTRPPSSASTTTTTRRPSTTSTTRPSSSSTSSTSTSSTTSTTTTTTVPPGPTLHRVAGDQLPSGPWALWAGGDGQGVVLELRLPARTWREEDAPAALTARWTVASTDRRHVAWGLTPADVTTVAVTLSDGRVVSVPTVDPAIEGVGLRLFAAQLPEGVTITAAEGRRADGSAAVRAEDVAASLEPVTGFDPAVRATVPVAAVPPG